MFGLQMNLYGQLILSYMIFDWIKIALYMRLLQQTGSELQYQVTSYLKGPMV
jgi:hypothetical protein